MPTTAVSVVSASSSYDRQGDLISRIASPDADVKLKALREVKNQIIGNRTKKLSFLKLGAVPAISAVLSDYYSAGDDDKCGGKGNILVQSAAALGSFACGFEAGVQAVLDAGAFPHLLRLLTNPDEKVVDAGARSLRMIFQSKLAPNYDFHQEKNMEFLFTLLNSENGNVSGLGASVISHACRTSLEQQLLCEAGVLEKLASLLDGSLSQRDSCLESLATVLKDNSQAISRFVGIENGRCLSSVTALLKDRYPKTRLLSCLCLVVINNSAPCYLEDKGIKIRLLSTMLELLDDSGQVGDEAALGFSTLLAGKEDLQKLAYEANAIEKLLNYLRTSELRPKRRQGMLLSLAEMCSKLEECRSRFLSLQVVDVLSDGLRHESADVRCAACICLRNSARSIKNLSAGLFIDEKIMFPLVQLLQYPSTSVQVSALGAISNIVVDFTTRRSRFIECGGTKQLIELSKSMDPQTRVGALQALRNLMFLADIKCKEMIYSDLKAPEFSRLITDPEPSVQEQALALLRNLVDGCISSIEFVLDEDCLVLDAVGRQLRKVPQPEIAIQGMYVFTNVASGSELHKEAVMHQILPQEAESGSQNFVLKFLQSSEKKLRTATVWTIINLTSPSSLGAFDRHVKLRDAGIISQLKNMVTDPCLDVKIRVRTVLGQSMLFGEN
ncbi:PREDICTED: armadillo repeat-containing protein 8 [Tarenaya hassleriana]|uniref:armadillo repeat-containing protein 8 n=1 Tax=Tarenaya hassleriana TaxID=28532 RepID=UPI00053C3DAA|nr:PREDICTED: armadillo repeat-containing protein 8 [Tarenaya hassleriana]